MSIRPHDGGRPPAPPAIRQWPEPPERFEEDERGWWVRLGESAASLGTISTSDLGVAERAAQISARADRAFRDPDFAPTALNALLRLELDYWKQLGLSPQSRRSVTPLPTTAGESGFEDIEDERAPGAVVGRIGHN
jgi:hypothetical protein